MLLNWISHTKYESDLFLYTKTIILMPDFKLFVCLEWVYAKARTCYAGCHARTYTGINFLIINLSILLSFYLSLCLSIYLFIYYATYSGILLVSIFISTYIHMYIYFCIYPCLYVSIYLSCTSLSEIYWLSIALKPGVSWPSCSPLPRTMALKINL